MKYPFKFKVVLFSEDDGKYFINQGMGICESFGDAATQIEKAFNNELIAIKDLELYEATEVICLPENALIAYDTADFPIINFEKECNKKGEII